MLETDPLRPRFDHLPGRVPLFRRVHYEYSCAVLSIVRYPLSDEH